MPCGGPRKSPCTSSIVQVILSFWSRNVLSVKIHVLANVLHIWPHLDNISLSIDYPVESSVILFGSMLPNLKGH